MQPYYKCFIKNSSLVGYGDEVSIEEYPYLTAAEKALFLYSTTNEFKAALVIFIADNTSTPSAAVVLPYKVYTALLTQSATSAPVATILQNTFPSTFTWFYDAVGQYYVQSSAAAFFANKTFAIFSTNVAHPRIATTERISDTVVSVAIFNSLSPSVFTNTFLNAPFEIRVYN